MQRLLTGLAQTGDGALVVDSTRRIRYWNPAAEALTGFTQEEVRGRPCYVLLGGTDEQGRLICQAQCWVAAAGLRGQPADSFDTAIRTKSGEPRWVNMSTFVYPSSGQEASLLVHLFRDATQKKQMERFVQALRQRLAQFDGDPSIAGFSSSPAPHHQPLTPRESETLTLLVQGHNTREIAQALVISPSTVRNHIRHILNKFGVHSRLEAVAYAFKYGLVPRDPD